MWIQTEMHCILDIWSTVLSKDLYVILHTMIMVHRAWARSRMVKVIGRSSELASILTSSAR